MAISYSLILEQFWIIGLKMLLNRFVFFVFLSITSVIFAQKEDSLAQDSLKEGFWVEKDVLRTTKDSLYPDSVWEHSSLAQKRKEAIDLEEVLVLGKLRFDNPKERLRYLILQRKTRKVWPYATLAAKRLMELNSRLEKIEGKSNRRAYIKMIQRYLEDEFKEELKNLTKTEGQILVKLLYRQTGITTYELVRELRSGWNAFWYNATAGLFNISLKEKYLPNEAEEDFLIEDILQRSFRKNILKPQAPAVEIDYVELLEQWR